MLKHPKHPIVKNDVWELTLRGIGYGPLMSSHRGDDWVNNKVLEFRSNDIVPIGSELYHVTFDVNDDFITVERITEKLADRFKLSTNCECISTNLVDRYLMAEFKDDVKWSDRVRLDKFSATESSVVVSTSPEWEALYRVTRSDEWTAHTLNSGGEWAVRGFTYQVLSIVPPQDIPEGHVVGWIELRLKEQNPEHPAVN
ncbi:MAG: hypothetical protein DWI22_18420 [Planctomycetota bacterium]|nr:MAG: hypothetical protein DWI22_18420 [Planctomycetota bacterium]